MSGFLKFGRLCVVGRFGSFGFRVFRFFRLLLVGVLGSVRGF